MSTIGRIFIVLNLILSACFLGWAANAVATNQNYKKQFEDEKAARAAEVEDLNGQIGELNAKLGDADRSKVRFRDERDDAQAQVESLKSRLAEASRENDQLRADVTKINQTLDNYNDTIAKVSSEKDRAVQESRQMERERDEAVDAKLEAQLAQRDAEERFGDAETKISELEVAMNDTRQQLSKTQTQLATLVDMTGVTLDQLLSQPLISATVLSVRDDLPPGLVALNKGEKDGVKRGMLFEIYRNNVYKGQVHVQSVRPEMCSALVVRNVDGTRMSQGDQATTRL